MHISTAFPTIDTVRERLAQYDPTSMISYPITAGDLLKEIRDLDGGIPIGRLPMRLKTLTKTSLALTEHRMTVEDIREWIDTEPQLVKPTDYKSPSYESDIKIYLQKVEGLRDKLAGELMHAMGVAGCEGAYAAFIDAWHVHQRVPSRALIDHLVVLYGTFLGRLKKVNHAAS